MNRVYMYILLYIHTYIHTILFLVLIKLMSKMCMCKYHGIKVCILCICTHGCSMQYQGVIKDLHVHVTLCVGTCIVHVP